MSEQKYFRGQIYYVYPSEVTGSEQIESVDKERFGNYINEVSQEEMTNLEKAMLVSLQISTNLKGSKALEVWRKMMESYDSSDEPQDQIVTKTSSREEKKPEKGMETVVIPADGSELRDIEAESAYIKLETERDVYKKLYMDLLKILRAV